MDQDELIGKIIIGEFVNSPRKELTETVYDLSLEQCGRDLAIKTAYQDDLD
jgi:2-oxoglutarate ferredoxin oxidoreductase subunit beta